MSNHLWLQALGIQAIIPLEKGFVKIKCTSLSSSTGLGCTLECVHMVVHAYLPRSQALPDLSWKSLGTRLGTYYIYAHAVVKRGGATGGGGGEEGSLRSMQQHHR